MPVKRDKDGLTEGQREFLASEVGSMMSVAVEVVGHEALGDGTVATEVRPVDGEATVVLAPRTPPLSAEEQAAENEEERAAREADDLLRGAISEDETALQRAAEVERLVHERVTPIVEQAVTNALATHGIVPANPQVEPSPRPKAK